MFVLCVRIHLIQEIILSYISIKDYLNLKTTSKLLYEILSESEPELVTIAKNLSENVCMDFCEERRYMQFNYCDVFCLRGTRSQSMCSKLAAFFIQLPIGSQGVKNIRQFFDEWKRCTEVSKQDCWVSYNLVRITREFKKFLIEFGLKIDVQKFLHLNWCLIHAKVLNENFEQFVLLATFFEKRQLFHLFDPATDSPDL